jgi:hypothetical protein
VRREIPLAAMVVILVSVNCGGQSSLPPGKLCVDELEALLITKGPNSATEKMDTFHPLDHHGAIHRCGRGSIADGGTFYEEIYQYRSIDQAEAEYDRQLDVFFYENEYIGPWQEPEFTTNLDLAVDEYFVACAERDSGTILCKMLARYDVMVIRLNTNRTLTSMSLSDFQSAIESVDTQFR